MLGKVVRVKIFRVKTRLVLLLVHTMLVNTMRRQE